MPKLKESLKISRNLLNELVNVWVERRGGFALNKEIVRFSLLDVCLGLGLRVVGTKLDLDECFVESQCRKHFDDENVDVKMVYEFLMQHHGDLTVVDFCRLYVLIGICEFLLSSRRGRIFPILFNIVDDFGSLGKYNWGSLVYEYLVESLYTASLLLSDEGNAKYFHVDGCVYLLQLWAFEHLLIWKRKGGTPSSRFPRILHWMDVKVGDSVVSRSLKKKAVLHDVVVSEEELKHVVVQEGFHEYGCGFGKVERRSEGGCSSQDKEELMREILEQEVVIEELKQSIDLLKTKMKERRKKPPTKYDPCYGTNGCASQTHDHSFDLGGKSVEEDDEIHKSNDMCDEMEESNMYARMKHQPRTRYKSRSIRTPFASYGIRRLKK
ncbi:uncharacterized protein LOC114184548 [Vigna unguiculata]|uniref:uncharacterized protein LOC114184548 n=1 Tax=Vigna unguiculata TaxID=3917 RepID=UPI0010164110|nr:uncharacterized protein LOC114184548 [Vigna unguiculata]